VLILNNPDTLKWVANATEADPRIASAAIGWLRDDEHTCGVFYENFTGSSITATIAVAPGAVIPKEFLRAIFTYPFEQLGCRKILALVAEDNHKSRGMLEKMGFIIEAVVMDYYPDTNLIIYALSKHLCRFLEKDDGQEI
jgi:hypothetical protein